ncbi:uncharacterized protein Eint_110130 [Encephalitozoon intestinalis ATCC 50506]|uniref:Uncharacterized protein n=1 Tax=Encephalitozoon intestinalis (strain ATCC 50506) TaxID=876142 RepID=E0SA90_ENCIT|nr:uncharacterized protein Eint_110130 [Encephalitozoon intestinalis ATCC 50506]ADM12515.1 hypothetical protein Eint_110130 [Encephalitozoon intestinalis ATCC 50506]UTX46368.1 hypothetical protein GPK93_11g19730 [Encephalitozoon intestinalis]
MDRMIEEVVRRKTRMSNENLKALFKQKKPDGQESVSKIEVEYEFVVKVDPTKFASCPIIEAGNDYYFCTFDGRDLMFNPKQVSPYIFLPFPLRKVIFHRSGDKMYFITLDTSNKLQYSLFINGYPAEERSVISRNVLQVTRQSGKVFYISTKNELLYINMVVEDGGALRGRMCVSGIKSKLNISIFYVNSILFMNVESRFHREDGKELPVQGDQMCEIGGKILVLDGKEKELWAFLLDEEYILISQLKIPVSKRVSNVFPLGNTVGVVVGEVLYLINECNGNLFVEREVDLKTSPLYISLCLKDNVVKISEIIADETSFPKEADDINTTSKDSANIPDSLPEGNPEMMDSISFDGGDVKTNKNDSRASGKFPLLDSSPCPNLFLGSHEEGKDGHRTTEEKSVLTKEEFSMDHFSPYIPDKSDCGEIKFLSEKIDSILKVQEKIEKKMDRIERDNSERFRKLIEISARPGESQRNSGSQELSGGELERIIGILNGLESKLKSDLSNESKILDCVKKIILGTLVPAVEAAMDEMRIQVINEIRLIHNEDHLKNVKKAVDCLHSSFNKQNEIKGLISEGLIEEAAEIAVKGSESNLETFVSNVEISCLEHLASSILVALLERVLVMAKDEFKPVYQNFAYMAMMCLEPNDLNDEEIQVLEILMAYINNIEDFALNDTKGLSVLLDFQRLKINKLKDKRGIR